MGFLDRLLGRGKQLAGDAAARGREMADRHDHEHDHEHDHAPGPTGGAVPEAGSTGAAGGAGASTPETGTSGQVTPP